MSSDADKNDDVRSIDKYVTVQRRLDLDPEMIVQMRRRSALHDVTADAAIRLLQELQDVFITHQRVVNLLCEHGPTRCVKALAGKEGRLAYLCSSFKGELRTDHAMQIMTNEPSILFMDNMTLMACVDNLRYLIPDTKNQVHFLRGFTEYFRIPPTSVSTLIADKEIKTPFLLQLRQLLRPLAPQPLHTVEPCTPPKLAKRKIKRNVIAFTPQSQTLIDWLRLQGFTVQRSIVAAGYLEKDCGSANAGLEFVQALHAAGWNKLDLAKLGREGSAHARKAGAETLIRYQTMLEAIGADHSAVICFICDRINGFPPAEELAKRIHAALDEKNAITITKLIQDAPRALIDFSVEKIEQIRAGWEEHGKNIDNQPKLLLQKAGDVRINPRNNRTDAYTTEASREQVSQWAATRPEITTLVADAPELAPHTTHVYDLLDLFHITYKQSLDSILKQLASEKQRAVLLEYRTWGGRNFMQRINMLRRLDVPSKLLAPEGMLDFTHDWLRLYASCEEVQQRLNRIEPYAKDIAMHFAGTPSDAPEAEGEDVEIEDEPMDMEAEGSPDPRRYGHALCWGKRYALYQPLLNMLFEPSHRAFEIMFDDLILKL